MRALRLPTFEVDGMRLVKRLTMIVRNGRIEHVLYPVFPPNKSADEVLRRVRSNPIPHCVRPIDLLSSFRMDLAVTFPIEGDEIFFSIMAKPTSPNNVVNFESRT